VLKKFGLAGYWVIYYHNLRGLDWWDVVKNWGDCTEGVACGSCLNVLV
jgi:hypothetical protein